MSMKTKNGGWKMRLRRVYTCKAEWLAYSAMYGLAARLGYKSAERAWKENPMVAGSVNPADYRKVRA